MYRDLHTCKRKTVVYTRQGFLNGISTRKVTYEAIIVCTMGEGYLVERTAISDRADDNRLTCVSDHSDVIFTLQGCQTRKMVKKTTLIQDIHIPILLSDERPEQISDYMESIVDRLAPTEISRWFKRVAEHAQQICPEDGIEYRASGRGFGGIFIPNRKSIPCVIDSIKVQEELAPELVRAILTDYRTRLEQKL